VSNSIISSVVFFYYFFFFFFFFFFLYIFRALNRENEAAKKAGNQKLKKLVAELKGIANRPVIISGRIRFKTDDLNQTQYLDLLEATLRDTGIAAFIFHDNVGDEDSVQIPKTGLAEAESAALHARYLNVAAICLKIGIKMWADTELMVGQEDHPPATNLARFMDQLNAARDAEQILVFSTSHYLTALGGNPGAELQRHVKDLLAKLDGPVRVAEVLRRLRAGPPNATTPVIVVSIVGEKATIDQCMSAGANAYHVKPIRRAELIAALKAQLESRHKLART